LKPFVIAIANEKGGVAKTTTALTLGASLAAMDQKVLLLDLDPQSNLSLALGLIPGEGNKSLLHFFTNGSSMQESIVTTEIPQLSVIPSQFEIAQVENSNNQITVQKLRQGISNLVIDFSYLLIDCPPHLGMLTRNALVTADLLILPTQAKFFFIYALKTMMNLVREIRAESNPDITCILLLTMFDKRNRIHRTLSDESRKTFGLGVFNTVIEIDTRLRESQVVGLPINLVSPSSRSAVQYRELAQEIETYAKAKRN
jgi:chromosome partitioning protein